MAKGDRQFSVYAKYFESKHLSDRNLSDAFFNNFYLLVATLV